MDPLAFLRRLRRSSRAAAADVFPHERWMGRGHDWTPTSYGEYYAKAPTIYSAINIRANALTRAPLKVYQLRADGSRQALPPGHRLQHLMDSPNPHYTGTELRRATEINLCLWGKAYWSIEVSDQGQLELWPLRPDRLLTLPGSGRQYVKGYLYRGETAQEIPYLPEEIITFTYFNPLQDRTGMSPIAPLRMTADMNHDALQFNRTTLQNGGRPDVVIMSDTNPTDQEVKDFYKRWDERFSGPKKAGRPALIGSAKAISSVNLSQREMEFTEGLKWTVEEVARVYGVPQPMLGSLREATLANVESLERIFWRTTMVPETQLFEDRINQEALPKLGWGSGYAVEFDLAGIDALTEEETPRLNREKEYLDRGVVTINEVRQSRGLKDIAGGDDPDAPSRRMKPPFQQPGQPTREAPAAALSNGSTVHNGAHP